MVLVHRHFVKLNWCNATHRHTQLQCAKHFAHSMHVEHTCSCHMRPLHRRWSHGTKEASAGGKEVSSAGGKEVSSAGGKEVSAVVAKVQVVLGRTTWIHHFTQGEFTVVVHLYCYVCVCIAKIGKPHVYAVLLEIVWVATQPAHAFLMAMHISLFPMNIDIIIPAIGW